MVLIGAALAVFAAYGAAKPIAARAAMDDARQEAGITRAAALLPALINSTPPRAASAPRTEELNLREVLGISQILRVTPEEYCAFHRIERWDDPATLAFIAGIVKRELILQGR
jgi:hypothetical protein